MKQEDQGYQHQSHGGGNNGYGGDHGTGSPAIKEDGCVLALRFPRIVSFCFSFGRRVKGCERASRSTASRLWPGTYGMAAVLGMSRQQRHNTALLTARCSGGWYDERTSSTLFSAPNTSIGARAHGMWILHTLLSRYFLASLATSDTTMVACVRSDTKWHWMFRSLESGTRVLVSVFVAFGLALDRKPSVGPDFWSPHATLLAKIRLMMPP